MRLQTTLVRLKVPYGPLPRGSLGVIADDLGRRTYLVRWLDPLAGQGAHEAPGGTAEVREEALEGVGLVVIDAPPQPDPDAASRLWVPGS